MNADATVWRDRAVDAHAKGDHRAAIAAFGEALALSPDDAKLLFEASVPHIALNETEAAIGLLRRSLDLAPENTDALTNASLLATRLGERQEARQYLETLLALDPGNAVAANNLAVLLIRAGDRGRACDLLDAAVTANPGHLPARRNLAGLLHQLGRFSEAAAHYRKIIELVPDDPSIPFLLDALTQSNRGRAEAPPPAYVQSLFDAYAETFEADLVEKLGYRAPGLLTGMIFKARGPAARFDTAFDVGCGTGLAGPHLRPLCGRLIGIDLSSKMLAVAAERNLYDALVEEDAVTFLARNGIADLIMVADVLLYVGDPDPFIAAVHGALNSGGLFALTTESAGEDEAPDGFCLRQSGRFAHARDAVVRSAESAGLTLSACEETVLRSGENGLPIKGDLFLFARD